MKGGEIMKIGSLIVVLVFIAFDVATGWLKAIATGTTDSSIMRQGLFHKLGEILAVMFGYMCEYLFPYMEIDVTIPFAIAIATYIVLMETASIIENLCIMNPNLANVMGKIFDKSKFEEVDDENKSGDSKGSNSGEVG